MVNDWNGKVAVVSGGAQGIGAAVVRAGIAAGGFVWALDIDRHRGDELLATTGPGLRFIEVDVTDVLSVADALSLVRAEVGGVDILVNCASREVSEDALTLPVEAWDEILDLDVKAAWLLSREVLPGMIERGAGAIVNIGSLHGTTTAEKTFPYGVAKAGLAALTRSLCLDFGPAGIRTNTVTPGWVMSERVASQLMAQGEDARGSVERAQPLRRLGSPDEIAAVVVFVASDAASYVSGADWVVDGGLSARHA